MPDVKAAPASVSLKPRSATPDETLAPQRRDYDRFGRLAREINLRLD